MTRDLDAVFQGGDLSTLFDRVSGEFVVRDGVLGNDDMRLDAPWGVLLGAGDVDLAAMTLDYGLAPSELAERTPVRIAGPWAAPEFGPDTEALTALQARAAQEAEAERQAAEDRAAAEVVQERAEQLILERAGDFLGVEIDTTDTPAEILRRLEQGATDGLERLIFGSGDEN